MDGMVILGIAMVLLVTGCLAPSTPQTHSSLHYNHLSVSKVGCPTELSLLLLT